MEQSLFLLISTVTIFVAGSIDEQLLNQDPSLWPGHLEAFGSQQNVVPIQQIDHWPDAQTFFKEYIDKNRPILFKGVVKHTKAFKLFDDDYLKNFQGSSEALVYAEPEKKENRTKKGFEMSFKDFIERYHKESLYMVNALPKELQKDVTMPPPLKCEETRDLMSSQVTWFSSGGTKSVIHNDDVDNINCLYRGTKSLLFVDYNKYKKFVRIDRPEGGYSSIDVDKVDYTKFPELRMVGEYVKANMEEGDCLFIPYHWYHQVNSVANDKGQNLAINIWFRHVIGHLPKQCDINDNEATLDKYRFPDDEREAGEGEDENEAGYIEHFMDYLKRKPEISLKLFTKVLAKDPRLNRDRVKLPPSIEDFIEVTRAIFEQLDSNKDEIFDKNDVDVISSYDSDKLNDMEQIFSRQTANIEDFFEDVVENNHQAQLNKENEPKKVEL